MGWGAKEQAANRGLREPCLAGTMPRCGLDGRVKILDTKFPGELRLPPVPKYGRSLSSRLLILYNSIVVGQSSPRNLKEINVFYVVFPSYLARSEHRYFHCRHACSVFSTFRALLWIMCLGYSRKRLYNSIVVGQSSPRNLKEINVFYVVFP